MDMQNTQTTNDPIADAEVNPNADYSATYSPDDNKLRLYSVYRLDDETYSKAKALGFRWAPKQQLFVAPMWTPAREDFLLSLCGEINDEDTSLVERAEERADRFDDYSTKRARDSQSASNAVQSITDHIPFGQPILIGHHSERRARKDAERIENHMRRAVKMWETSEYWEGRAAGALAHAKYKELPDVRYRRIKKIESEQRKVVRNQTEAAKWLAAWSAEALSHEQALQIANYSHLLLPRKEGDRPDFNQNPSAYCALSNSYPALYAPRTLDEIVTYAKKSYPRYIARAQRWINHYDNRLKYERAMLGESGGLAADKFNIEPGGMVLVCREWVTVVRVTRKNGAIVSVTTNARYVSKRSIEEVSDYRAPSDAQRAAVKAVTTTKPITNYPGGDFLHCTQAQWDEIPKDYKGYTVIPAKDGTGAHRVRHAIGVYLLPEGETDWNKRHHYYAAFVTDAKVKEPPKVEASAAMAPLPREPAMSKTVPVCADSGAAERSSDDIAQMRDLLKNGGVQVVSAPQLFQTPVALAARVIAEAGPCDGLRWLEPSAGAGRLCAALLRACTPAELVAVEIAGHVASVLPTAAPDARVLVRDFLELTEDELGLFDRVVMNPPFADAIDIKHILHAAALLKPGGVLVAICAGGPRQTTQLKPWAENSGGIFEMLPAGTFKEAGTNVSSALLVFNA